MRRKTVEGGAIGVKFIGPLAGDRCERKVFLEGLADGAIIHIGEIADMLHLVLPELEFEQTADYIVDQKSAEIADVRRRVNGRSTIIEAENPVLTRRQNLDFAGHRIVKAYRHSTEERRNSEFGKVFRSFPLSDSRFPLFTPIMPESFRLDLIHRPRRLRRTASLRSLVEETVLRPADFIAPLFVIDGRGAPEAIASMPGVLRHPLVQLVKECRQLSKLGVPAVALFPKIESRLKDAEGSAGLREDGLVLRAVRAIKR